MSSDTQGAPHDHESERRQQASLLRIAGRMARFGGWAIDLATGEAHWSEEMFDILGFPPGQAPEVEDTLKRYIGDSEAIIRAALDRTARDGTPFDVELEIRDYHDQHLHVRAVGEAERDAAGAVRRIIGAFQDVTPIKAAERRLLDIGQRLTATLEAMTEAFVLLDPEWRFAYLNHEAEGLLQRTREDLVGKSIWSEFPATLGTEVETTYRTAVAEQRPRFLQTYFAPLNHWFEVWAHPSAEGLALYFRAIDDRKRAEEELRTSEERFRLLSKATHDAIWDWDIVNDVLWWNEGFETLFGFKRSDLEVSVHSWTKLIHPDERAAIEASVRAALEGDGEAWSASYRFQRLDGTYAHVLDRGHIIRDTQHRPIRMIGGMTDLSDRVAAEERLAEQAALLDEASDAILVRDLEHRALFWSKGAELMYGWRADEIMGKPVVDVAYEDPEQFRIGMQEVMATGSWEGELEQRHRDGTMLRVFSRWSLRRNRDGEPTSVLVIDTDVTTRRRLENQLLRSQRMESLGTLAGGIAHDLNNALAPILMSIEILRQAGTDTERAELLNTIEGSARRGADMVRQVLTFARGIEGQRVAINTADLLREVAKIVNETFLKAVHLQLELPAELWRIIGDPTQLHQVVLNLCLNARDAMAQGGTLRLTARSVRVDEALASGVAEAHLGPHVMIEVCDTGEGMTPEILDKVFEPFFTTKPVGEGTGLGLSTSKAIVESHNGFMRIYSEPGRGTTVRVFLPADPTASPSGEYPVIAAPPSGHGELILVVDDEPAVRAVVQRTLESFGYRVVPAPGGVEALAIYSERSAEIALVITDMMMPHMDGPALISAIRERNPQARIISASGLGTDSQIQAAAERGAAHFLAKPFTARTLLDTVRSALATD